MIALQSVYWIIGQKVRIVPSSLSDHVFIDSLEADVLIGAYTEERLAPQRVMIDLEIGFDFQQAIKTDQLSDTLDYDHFVTSLRNLIAQTRYTLLETLADTICRHCIQDYHASWVQIRLYKPNILARIGRVGIELTRHADDYLSPHYEC